MSKKPLQFANTHRPGINDIAVLAGCIELGVNPTGTSFDRTGQTVEVYFEGIEYPKSYGIKHTAYRFIEKDHWFVDQVIIGNELFTYPGELIPMLGGLMNKGECF